MIAVLCHINSITQLINEVEMGLKYMCMCIYRTILSGAGNLASYSSLLYICQYPHIMTIHTSVHNVCGLMPWSTHKPQNMLLSSPLFLIWGKSSTCILFFFLSLFELSWVLKFVFLGKKTYYEFINLKQTCHS